MRKGFVYLDFGLLGDSFLLLARLLLALVSVTGEVDLNTETVTEPVNTSALSTDDTSNVFTVNLELGGLK